MECLLYLKYIIESVSKLVRYLVRISSMKFWNSHSSYFPI